MPVYLELEPLPGVTDLISLMKFLSDEKSSMDRLKKMEKVRADINKLVVAQAKLNEIDALHAKARSAKNDAAYKLDEAKKRAADMLGKAEQNAQKLEQESIRVRQAADSHAEAVMVDLTGRSKAVDDRETNVQKRRAEAERIMEQALELNDKAMKMEAEYKEQLSEIEALLDKLRA